MRVVLDTNTIISALLFSGTASRLVPIWQSGRIQPLLSRVILDEYLRADHPLLNNREKVILSLRYGVREGANVLTLAQVGHELGLSKERVRQMQATAIGKLRSALIGDPKAA